MCFRVDNSDWDSEEVTYEISPATETDGKCFECHTPHVSGNLVLRVHMWGWDTAFEQDEEGEYPPEARLEWNAVICGKCEHARDRIYEEEIAAGCKPYESICPYGELDDYIRDGGMVRSSQAEGQDFLRRKLAEQEVQA